MDTSAIYGGVLLTRLTPLALRLEGPRPAPPPPPHEACSGATLDAAGVSPASVGKSAADASCAPPRGTLSEKAWTRGNRESNHARRTGHLYGTVG